VTSAKVTAAEVNYFFLPFDPVLGLKALIPSVEQHVNRDPSLHDAWNKLNEHITKAIPTEETGDNILAPILWMQARDHLKDGSNVKTINQWLTKGEQVLRYTEISLTRKFAPQVLQNVVQEAQGRAQKDPTFAAQLQTARAELSQAQESPSTDVLLAMLLLLLILCIIAIIIICAIRTDCG